MKIYICTPVNGRKSERTFEDKYRAAEQRVAALKEVLRSDERFWGAGYLSSFDVNALGSCTEEVAMGRCVCAVMESDAIYLDHGWQGSKGCSVEYQVAKIYGKTVIEHDKLCNYE